MVLSDDALRLDRLLLRSRAHAVLGDGAAAASDLARARAAGVGV